MSSSAEQKAVDSLEEKWSLPRAHRRTLVESAFVSSIQSTVRFAIAVPEDAAVISEFLAAHDKTGAEVFKDFSILPPARLQSPFTILVADCFELRGVLSGSVGDLKQEESSLLDQATFGAIRSLLPPDCDGFFHFDCFVLHDDYNDADLTRRLWAEGLELVRRERISFVTAGVCPAAFAEELGLHDIQPQGRPVHITRMEEIETKVDAIRNRLPDLPAAYRVPDDGERPVIDEDFFVQRLGRSLRIEVARPADFAAIRAFMRNETIRQAPMAQTIQLSRAEIERKAARLQPAFFDDELTLLALDEQKICGIMINKHVRIDRQTDVHGDPNKTDFAAEIKAQGGGSFRLGVQWAFLRWIDSLVSQHLPADCSDLFVLDFLGVHPDYRGCRLGAKLWNESMRLAKRRGFRYVQCVCSAQASLRIATKSGMSTVFSWPWAAMRCGERALFPDGRMYDGGEHANVMVGDLHHIKLP